MTHNTPVCLVCACLYALMVERLYREPTLLDTKSSRELFLQYTMELALELECKFIAEADTSKYTDEKALATISFKLKEIWDNLDTLSNEKLIEISEGGHGFVVESLTMVIGILVSRDPSFGSVLTAALLGGDTDSNASMVAGILGGMKGVNFIPKTYIDQLYRAPFIAQTAKSFSIMLRDV